MEYRKSRHILELEQPFHLASLFSLDPVATVYMLSACGMLGQKEKSEMRDMTALAFIYWGLYTFNSAFEFHGYKCSLWARDR